MTKSQICIMISIVVYLAIVVIIGVIFSKKTKNVGKEFSAGKLPNTKEKLYWEYIE